MIIAIDGPAGAGKSTIARKVAEKLGFQLVDTGALYRAVAYVTLREGVDPADAAAVAELATGLQFEFRREGDDNVLYCDGEPLGQQIRRPEVSKAASVVSAHPEVRAALLDLQRDLGHLRDSVLEGRDIGTVVFPDAEVKVFLTASPEIRAQRRVAQLEEQGMDANYDEILAEIRVRDERDSTRAVAPLKKAADAVEIDSTAHSIDDVVDQILAVVRG